MAFFVVTVEKHQASMAEYWVNTYRVQAQDLAAAGIIGDSIADAELPMYPASIVITKVNIRDENPATDQFITLVYNQAGTRNTTGLTQQGPLFVCMRIDFQVANYGRPCRKYIRGLYEEDFGALLLNTNIMALGNTYAAAIANLAVVDPDGQDITSGAVNPATAMRQLRRGSKKRPPHSRLA